MTLPSQKTVLVSLIVLAATGWFCRQQRSVAQIRAEQTSAKAELVRLEAIKTSARERLASLEQELKTARSERDAVLATVVEQNQNDAARVTESTWNVPPQRWPDWNAGSPYVWLSKSKFKRMRAPVWDEKDGLREEIVALLCIQSEAREAIDTTVRRIMGEWRTAETAAATLSSEHLSNLAGKGAAVTVQVDAQPDLAVRLRKELHALLEQQLGEQRAELFEHFAGWRLDAEFGPEKIPPTGPKVYSVRREGKLYHVATRGWSGSMGTSGNWRDNIPAHLHPIFDEALKQR